MAFSIDMPRAARRHLEAAQLLNDGKRRDVAGYLFGIAAECAIKSMMIDAGLKSAIIERRADPYYAHFPSLRTILRDQLQGRRGTPLIRFIEDAAFMAQWSTDMRYSPGSEVLLAWVDRWAEQAKAAVTAMGS